MKNAILAATVAVLLPFTASHSQTRLQKSRSSGFFLGLGVEGNGLTTSQSGSSVTESGGGGGLVLGYGFSPTWSLYSEMSGATMNANGGGTYTLGHFDVGARVHFRSGPNVVVPFLQFGLDGRGVAQTVNGTSESATGGGVSAGGGLNVHFNPAVALSTAVTWSVGNFTNFQAGNFVANGSVTATSARLHLGLIWFPQG